MRLYLVVVGEREATENHSVPAAEEVAAPAKVRVEDRGARSSEKTRGIGIGRARAREREERRVHGLNFDTLSHLTHFTSPRYSVIAQTVFCS